MQSKSIADTLENVLHEVQRPARYVGGEINSIVKEWSPSDSLDQIKLKQALLRRGVRGRGMKLSLNKPRETMMESWFPVVMDV